MHARIGDLLQFVERQQVIEPIESALAAVHDAAILAQHPRVGVEHPRVGVAVVVPLDLWLELRPAVVPLWYSTYVAMWPSSASLWSKPWNSSWKASFSSTG